MNYFNFYVKIFISLKFNIKIMAENFLEDWFLNEKDIIKLESLKDKKKIPEILKKAIKTQQGLTVSSLKDLKYVFNKVWLKNPASINELPELTKYKIEDAWRQWYSVSETWVPVETTKHPGIYYNEGTSQDLNPQEHENILDDWNITKEKLDKIEGSGKDVKKILKEIIKRKHKVTVDSLESLKYVLNKILVKNRNNIADIPDLSGWYVITDEWKKWYSVSYQGYSSNTGVVSEDPKVDKYDPEGEDTFPLRIARKNAVKDILSNWILSKDDIQKLETLEPKEIKKKLEETIKNLWLTVNSLELIRYILIKIWINKRNMQGLQEWVNYKITFENWHYFISGVEKPEETEKQIETNNPADKIKVPIKEPKPKPKQDKLDTKEEDKEVKKFMENRKKEILAEMDPEIYKKNNKNALLWSFHPEDRSTYFWRWKWTEPVKEMDKIFIAESLQNIDFKDKIWENENKIIISNVNGKEVLRFYLKWELHLATIVSPWLRDKETPRWNFTLSRTDKYHASSEYPEASNWRKKWGAVMPYGIFIEAWSLLHGSDSLIDWSLRSHGCIRVPLYYMKEIYEQVESLGKIKIDTTWIYKK